jgi:hypothetical protein
MIHGLLTDSHLLQRPLGFFEGSGSSSKTVELSCIGRPQNCQSSDSASLPGARSWCTHDYIPVRRVWVLTGNSMRDSGRRISSGRSLLSKKSACELLFSPTTTSVGVTHTHTHTHTLYTYLYHCLITSLHSLVRLVYI